MSALVHVLITMVAVWVTTALPGITLSGEDTLAKVLTLLAVSVIFAIVNAVLKPIAKTLGCLLYVLTLGLFGLVVNALLYWLTGYWRGSCSYSFQVDGFWPASGRPRGHHRQQRAARDRPPALGRRVRVLNRRGHCVIRVALLETPPRWGEVDYAPGCPTGGSWSR